MHHRPDKSKPYKAQVTSRAGTSVHLGYFATAEEAALFALRGRAGSIHAIQIDSDRSTRSRSIHAIQIDSDRSTRSRSIQIDPTRSRSIQIDPARP